MGRFGTLIRLAVVAVINVQPFGWTLVWNLPIWQFYFGCGLIFVGLACGLIGCTTSIKTFGNMMRCYRYLWLLAAFSCWVPVTLVGLEWIQPPLATKEGYPVPQPDTQPQLPAAHGAHPAYAIEWWYWVGHLHTLDKSREFGFQGTVFRSAGAPDQADQPSEACFGLEQLYLVHVGKDLQTIGIFILSAFIVQVGKYTVPRRSWT